MGCGSSGGQQTSQPAKASPSPAAEGGKKPSATPEKTAPQQPSAGGAGEELDKIPETTDQEDEEALKELEEQRYEIDKKTGDAKEKTERKEKTDDFGFFEEADVGEGKQFMAVKPWIGALVPPTSPPEFNSSEPTEEYELEHAYGYRSHDCRNNLFFSASGKAVYPTAALGVVHDIYNNTQKFFGGKGISMTLKKVPPQHDDDIISLAISPDRKLVASGQVGAKPTFYIWDAETQEMVSKIQIKERNTRAIANLCWSSDGNYVACVDKSNDNNVYLYTKDGARKFSKSGGQQPIYGMAWSKKPGEMRFATCGKRHINFWELNGDSDKGFGHSAQTFACCTFDNDGNCYAGGLNGRVYQFIGRQAKSSFKAHNGLIEAINFVDGILLTGGRDHQLKGWTGEKQMFSVDAGSAVRSIDLYNGQILVGTKGGDVKLYDNNGQLKQDVVISHHDGEVWGLEVVDNKLYSAGDDDKILEYDITQRKCKVGAHIDPDGKAIKLKYGASSITNHPDNQCCRALAYCAAKEHLAVAQNSGSVQIRDAKNLSKVIKKLEEPKRWIECMVYSPNNQYLAVGCHDEQIYIYQVDGYSLMGALHAHHSAILGIDWTTDSTYIRSNCQAYELLFFDIIKMEQDPSGATNTKDMDWATQTCKLGWAVTGIFPSGSDGSDVNKVEMSKDKKLIASGDDRGLVNIYRNPCLDGAKGKSFRGHSEHVVGVKFGLNDQYLFSAGGQDKTILQWRKK